MRNRKGKASVGYTKAQTILFGITLLFHSATFAYSSETMAEGQPVAVSPQSQSQSQSQSPSPSSHHIVSADAQKQGVGQNIQFVEQLVLHSNTAAQIQQGDNAEAKALQQQAAHELERAKQAQQAGDIKEVTDALNKAKHAIFQAMRLSGSKVIKEKEQNDFDTRIKSTTALLDAHKRIRLEKKLGPAAEGVEKHVASEIQSARSEFKSGQMDKAMKTANAAYLSIKLSVMRLRDGDTLVRELHFATKKDEYKYELERNRTHRILVEVVLKEKLSPQMSMLMKFPMDKAEELREQAVKQAEGGDYEKAIKTLEQSTQQIIRAIRMAGVYIPG